MSEYTTLKAKQLLEISPRAPFNFDATMHKPDHFPSQDNEWQSGIRWQTMLWKERALGLKLENQGTTDRPQINLSVWSKEKLTRKFADSLIEEINYRCNLQSDLAEFNQRFTDNPLLKPVIDRWRGMRPSNFGSLYEYLIIAIILQNATVRRSVNMMRALFEKYGALLAFDNKELFCFWQPEAIYEASEHDLRDLKMGYRAKSIKRVTEAFLKNEIDEQELRTKTLFEQRASLLRLYGIGPASAGYILLDVFHQWNELIHIFPWEQRIYSKLFFNKEPTSPASAGELIHFFGRHFSGYKMLAVHYIWEDLFWKRKNEEIPWLHKMIRL